MSLKAGSMSFKEKSAAVTLIALIIVYGGYFWGLGDWGALPPIEEVGSVLIGRVGLLVAILIGLHIVVGISDQTQETDERDRLIATMGARNGGHVVGIGAVGAMLALLAEIEPVRVVHILLASLALGEAVTQLSKLVYYRRGT